MVTQNTCCYLKSAIGNPFGIGDFGFGASRLGRGGILAGLFLMVALSARATDLARVSVGPAGLEANGHSLSRPALSADGRYVAFSSAADNLVAADDNDCDDVFVRDQVNETTTRVSLTSGGTEGNGWSRNPAISADGRYVAFVSVADNLVAGDTNQAWDVFVYDRQNATVERVSLAHDGGEAQHGFLWHEFTMRYVPQTDDPQLYPPALSADGRYVVFVTDAPNLVVGDTNDKFDVFVRDRQANTIERVSVATGGGESDGGSHQATISADGRYVVFNSAATNLVVGDTNDRWDTFLHDRQTGTTERVSLAHDEAQANGESTGIPTVAAGGRYVGFTSDADNLVAGDTNGQPDVFLRDRQAGTTVRVSVRASGDQANGGGSFQPALSADGRLAVFASAANNVVPGTAGGSINIFLADLNEGTVVCVSRTDQLKPSHGHSQLPVISADGGVIAFSAEADDLVADDTNAAFDIFASSGGTGGTAFTLTLQAAPAVGGSVAPAIPVSVAAWQAVDLAATPAFGYDFTDWSVLSGNATIGEATAITTTVTLNADSVIAANFALHRYPVTFATTASPANATLSGDTAQTVAHGGSATPVTANAPEGYRFVKWTQGGLDYAVANPLTVGNVTAAVAVVANFAPEHLRFHTVEVVAGANGAISGPRFQVVAHGELCAPVDALPDDGFRFLKWTAAGVAISESNPLAIQVTADLVLVANFAPPEGEWYTVTFLVDGPGTLVGEAIQVVRNDADCAPVTALVAAGCLFRGWSGDFFGKVNPLALDQVRRDLTVTAHFLDPASCEPLARGARFEIEADEAGLVAFAKQPKIRGRYFQPFGPTLQTHQKQAAAKLVGAFAPGVTSLAAEWTKAVRLYDAAAFKRAQRMGVTAAEWLSYQETQSLLALDLWLASPETEPADQLLRPAILMPPAITAAPVVADGNLTLVGNWFGTAKPKVWLEVVTASTVLRIKLKVLPPLDPNFCDVRGNPAFMNAADGTSQLIVVLPVTYPHGITPAEVGAIIIDNGVGLATRDLDLAD